MKHDATNRKKLNLTPVILNFHTCHMTHETENRIHQRIEHHLLIECTQTL